MNELNWFERIIEWLFTPKYCCEKGKHKWIYSLSESGKVYICKEPPDELLFCEICGIRKKNL